MTRNMACRHMGGKWRSPIALSMLALALIIIQTLTQANVSRAADGEILNVPKSMKFVRVRLGRKSTPGVGDLGQPVTSYYVNMDIGTPPKAFKMLVDVNARENFVPHYLVLHMIYSRLNYKNGYNKKDSTSSEKEEDGMLTIGYQGCALTGKAYTDVFELKQVVESYKRAGYKQRFLAMSSASNDRFVRYSVDGVIALNPWPVSATGSELLSVNLARVDLMGELKFALHLVEGEGDSESDGGELILGAVNPTKFLGALRYHQVVAQHAWELPLAGVMLGGSSINSANNMGAEYRALLSTSSNGITGPARAVGDILELLGIQNPESGTGSSPPDSQSKLYTIDCDKRQSAPELTFIFEDARYSIPPTAYIKVKPASTFRKATCYLELYSNYAVDNKWELGTNFLSNFYTVFDINSRKVALGSLHVQKS